MGNRLSNAVKEAQAQADANQRQVEADLKNLNEILTSKAEEYFLKLINNKGEDKTIPIKTLIEYKKHVSCSVSSGPSDKLNEAVEELFGGNFMSSLKAMALGAIDAVLGNTSAGSREETGYKVLLLNNTIVRVDYYVFGYNMHTAGGLVDRKRNGLAFVATVGVVDMKLVGLEALVYLVGSQANAARVFMNQRYEDWNVRLKAINAFRNTLPAVTDASFTAAKLNSQLAQPGSISLETLQAYLDEADAESETTSREGETTGPVFKAEDEEARATAVKAYYDKKLEVAGDATAATAAADTVAKLYITAWQAVYTRANSQISRMTESHKDLLRAMTREQEAIMEDMKSVYMKARAITAAIQGVGPA